MQTDLTKWTKDNQLKMKAPQIFVEKKNTGCGIKEGKWIQNWILVEKSNQYQ